MAKSKVSLDKDGKELTTLRKDVEAAVGRSLTAPNDFAFLSEAVQEKIHEYISVNTLKRIWGYIDNGGSSPTNSTLSVLSRYLGYSDWNDFLANLDTTATSQSFFGEGVSCDALNVGDRIKVSWKPNREILLRYTGGNGFIVEDAKNSKLVKGDTFKCMYFIESQPLYLDALMHEGFDKPMSYICGKQGGVHLEQL